MALLHNLLLIFISFAGGIAVGSGFVAFITVLDIVPRMARFSRSPKAIHRYEYAFVWGALVFTWLDFRDISLAFPVEVTILLGILAGCFVGFLAGALTEVVNVLPILSKRLRMERHVVTLLMAMVFGKVIGSLLQWIIGIP
ncbi:stage V sporulation protein AB [Mechercharimyces sp. CAU 1602]|uniref:stage V sporulation protein AB n=1 Tax=Mechercharimyces sp. CAU 1602 TaxID=2973933 RepID=UPI002162D64F|nr:stage V sporulation protein AB [Mechercharimyces sp. CAU 1602]MCS1350846.1 stage V sporulation protein AB [Mechercharimyces sp. CAU 1602]